VLLYSVLNNAAHCLLAGGLTRIFASPPGSTTAEDSGVRLQAQAADLTRRQRGGTEHEVRIELAHQHFQGLDGLGLGCRVAVLCRARCACWATLSLPPILLQLLDLPGVRLPALSATLAMLR
jgi:hypothetical protein